MSKYSYEFTQSNIDKTLVDEKRFLRALNECGGPGTGGIGTLSEKSVHAVLKNYYVPNKEMHEITINKYNENISAKYVADAMLDGEIYEIQSRHFYSIGKKLEEFLRYYDVTVVYPLALNKTIRYVDIRTGEVEKERRSSKRGNIFDFVSELYGIKDLLQNERLHFIVCFLETQEYKLVDVNSKGSRRNSVRTDKVPTKILGEFRIDTKYDYLKLLPKFSQYIQSYSDVSKDTFTSRDIAQITGNDTSVCGVLLNILYALELVQRVGREGRCYLYKISEDML